MVRNYIPVDVVVILLSVSLVFVSLLSQYPCQYNLATVAIDSNVNIKIVTVLSSQLCERHNNICCCLITFATNHKGGCSLSVLFWIIVAKLHFLKKNCVCSVVCLLNHSYGFIPTYIHIYIYCLSAKAS